MAYQDSFTSGNQNPNDGKASPQQFSDIQPGAILGGRYEVVSLLGVGGMGVVYRVNQIFLDKHFALKTIGRLQTSDTQIRRFQLEARAAFAVSHPNIIAVNDFGLLDDSTPFLVMELIEGQTLTDRLKEKEGKLTITEAIQIFVQACFGLAYAHENGIVHRDIKPSNIMILNDIPLSSEGSVKIVDFGIAKFAQHDAGEVQALTKTGEIFGSPLYMSPEQCSGEHVDFRSDIYSLGCVLFESLTGTPPFVGDSVISTMMQHISGATPTLKEASLGIEFPHELETIVAKMLEKSPENRYQNLGVVAHHLAAAGRGDEITAEVKTKPRSKPKNTPVEQYQAKTFYRALTGACLTTAIAAGSAGFFLHQYLEQEKNVSANESSGPHYESVKDYTGKENYVAKFIPLDLGTFNDNPTHVFGNFRWPANTPVKFQPSEAFLLAPGNFTAFPPNNLVQLNLQRGHLRAFFNSFAQNANVFGNLQYLQLDESDVTDDDLAMIDKLPALTQLNLDKTSVTGARVGKLRRSKSLTAISFNHGRGAHDLLQNIAGSSALLNLSLNDTHLSADDFDLLQSFSNLRILRLDDNQLSKNELAKLSNLRNLRELSVTSVSANPVNLDILNHMRRNGLQSISINKYRLTNSPSLNKWRVENMTPVDDENPIASQAQGFNFPPDISVGVLQIGSKTPISVYGYVPATRSDRIHFYTRHASRDYPELLDKFGDSDLTGLDVIFGDTQKVIDKIKNWKRLTELSFFNTIVKALTDDHEESPITNRQLPQLDKFSNLTSLGLCGPLVSGKAISEMSLLKRLKTLKIRRVREIDPLLKTLANCDNIEELWLVAQNTDNKQLELLTRMKNLHTLRIRRSNLSPNSLAVFSRMPALKHLILDRNSWSQIDKERFRRKLPFCEFEPMVDTTYWELYKKG
jgi:serine/threonine protein kinase